MVMSIENEIESGKYLALAELMGTTRWEAG
jgi:hypothetical protein